MKVEKTFVVNIYVGFREEYGDIVHRYDEAEQIMQDYCNSVSYGVSMTPTRFIYKDGNEDGIVIGLINYPRFPSSEQELLDKAFEIAKIFLERFDQNRISIVCSNNTYMIEKG